MAKLVILTQGLSGRAHELNVDRTTIGRVDDNTFQIAETSVSSHHCEVLLRGSDIVIKDLNSTNGTFINDQQVTGESVLKPGQTLRLGTVELKLETGGAAPASVKAASDTPANAGSDASAKMPPKKMEATLVIPRGVSLSELEGGGRPPGLDTSKEFSKKRNRAGIYFWIGAGVVVVVIVVLLLFALSQIKPSK
jgi:pSer/pThr/pTyr-binding forkhead associated (FHA) protein